MTTEKRTPVVTGGCQCGAVRYAVYAPLRGPHICHCRMCQKAFGSYFAALGGARLADIAWTRGAPKLFRSSSVVERGFCAECGTPLTYRNTEHDTISVSLGSLDRPGEVAPAVQYGLEAKVPFFGTLEGLPGTTTEDDVPADYLPKFKSRQHPDHDTPD